MFEARYRSHTQSLQGLKPTWLPLDVIVLTANGLLALTVLWLAPRLPHASAYVLLHVLIAAAVYVLAKYDDARSNPADPLTFLHAWLPAVFVMLVYFELGILIPLLREYGDHHYDALLQQTDVWLLGDPIAMIDAIARAPISDLLTICYVAYYPFALAVPVAMYARGRLDDYQHTASIVLMSFLVSYVGYIAWPALGPHRLYDAYRPVALDGYGLARVGYSFFRGLPNEPPDAFPSGHALIGVLAPALAWRFYRPLFAWLVPVGVGIVLATIYLRFHYIADVVASFLLAPVVWRLASAVERKFRYQPALRATESYADAP